MRAKSGVGRENWTGYLRSYRGKGECEGEMIL